MPRVDLIGEPSPEDLVLGLEELDTAAKLNIRGRGQKGHQRMKGAYTTQNSK